MIFIKVFKFWQGYLDSNQGMTRSKPVALPLGDNPTVISQLILSNLNMVRKERLELSHLAAPEPKSGASTNSATSAFVSIIILKIGYSI